MILHTRSEKLRKMPLLTKAFYSFQTAPAFFNDIIILPEDLMARHFAKALGVDLKIVENSGSSVDDVFEGFPFLVYNKKLI